MRQYPEQPWPADGSAPHAEKLACGGAQVLHASDPRWTVQRAADDELLAACGRRARPQRQGVGVAAQGRGRQRPRRCQAHCASARECQRIACSAKRAEYAA